MLILVEVKKSVPYQKMGGEILVILTKVKVRDGLNSNRLI